MTLAASPTTPRNHHHLPKAVDLAVTAVLVVRCHGHLPMPVLEVVAVWGTLAKQAFHRGLGRRGFNLRTKSG